MLSLNEDGVILKIFSFISLLYWTAFVQIKEKKIEYFSPNYCNNLMTIMGNITFC